MKGFLDIETGGFFISPNILLQSNLLTKNNYFCKTKQ